MRISIENILQSNVLWVVGALLGIYLYLKKVVFEYWKRHNVPHEEPTILIGTFGKEFFFSNITFANFIKSCYEKCRNHPFHGIYMSYKPVLMINDPELIKHILVKDFSSFCDRGFYSNPKVDPLSLHLFSMTGDQWKMFRSKFSHKFNSGKLKQIFPLLIDVADEMIDVCNINLLKSDIMDVKDIAARFTTDTILTFAFGFNGHTLRDPNSEIRHYGDLAIKSSPVVNGLAFVQPTVLDILRIPLLGSNVTSFFARLFKDMVNKRRMESENKNDFLDLLIHMMDNPEIIDTEIKHTVEENDNNHENIKRRLDILEGAAQGLIFIAAGFGMSASIIAHCLYELAINPDIQEKLHEEIDEFSRKPQRFDYENILQMKYLDMVLYETMRIHPSVPFLNRICIKESKIPNSSFCVPKNMPILISVSGLHRNPDIYPNPDKFDPTRFTAENIASRHPYAYLAFGEGPRICIGKRFGILQSKIGLLYLLLNYKFSVCEKTTIPNQYMNGSTFQVPRDVYLRAEKRNAKSL